MKKFIFIILITILCATHATEAKLTAMRGKVSDSYNFWFYEPDSKSATIIVHDSTDITPSDSLSSEELIAHEMINDNASELNINNDSISNLKPLIIFLHGRSLCGNNLNKVLRYGTIDAVRGGRKIDAYIIAPQNPGTFWNPDKIMNIVDWITERHAVDANRIYVLGMSLGGYGTIDLTAAYPERIAAAMALCGGGSRKDLSGLNQVPLWIIHGTADRAVSVNESRKVKNLMKSAGDTSLLRYDEWAGVNHGALARLFYMDKTYEWLFKHTLDNRVVDKSISITQGDTQSAYKGFKHRSSTKGKSAKNKKKSSKKKSSKKSTKSTKKKSQK
ncbi:MAG: dienelactone hydrolase family protein [Muribaculaceae bacterium]|nr:dienelactone hydrolase family protein [Muribaculaceae bacterium]